MQHTDTHPTQPPRPTNAAAGPAPRAARPDSGATSPGAGSDWRGDNRALLGIVLGVLTFWLFAQTTLNVGPIIAGDLSLSMEIMNIAIAVTALFSGMFIVVAGGVADRIGRVRMVFLGNLLNIVGSLLLATAVGALAAPMVLLARVLQGLAAAFIMPASLAIVKTYWHGPERQRAVSMWSLGSWGGGGFCSLFGGFVAGTALGWRAIFWACAACSVASILLMQHIPESKPAAADAARQRTDWAGMISFCIAMVALQVVITQGDKLGWLSPITLGLVALFAVVFTVFNRVESDNAHAFLNFNLFRNPVFTGTTVSNCLLNATAGILPVSLWVFQRAHGLTAAKAGYLTIGYAIGIVVFIRVGERLLQRFGARKPMAWGTLIVLACILLLIVANMFQDAAIWLSIIAYGLFGLGLAFYATPSTDTALNALPHAEAGAGAGIYKMASSLGAAFGVAVSAAVFTALEGKGLPILQAVTPATAAQHVHQAGIAGLAFNAAIAVIALVTILIVVPKDAGETIDWDD